MFFHKMATSFRRFDVGEGFSEHSRPYVVKEMFICSALGVLYKYINAHKQWSSAVQLANQKEKPQQ